MGDITLCPVCQYGQLSHNVFYHIQELHSLLPSMLSSTNKENLPSSIARCYVTNSEQQQQQSASMNWDLLQDIGLHSLRSGATLAMYLSSIPVFTIMLIGQWSSNAFLQYIRTQVQEFSAGVSRKMLTADVFFTIPEAQHEDPWVSGNLHNFVARNSCGHDAHDAAHPWFALWA